jgi:hypothetical protein
MMRIAALLLLLQDKPDPHLEAIREALKKTSADAYTYEVKGKYEREGEWHPSGVLTSRIKLYQSARAGEKVLVKGPEGLWKTPDERLGEKVEKPDPEAEPIVRLLQETEPPHVIVERALKAVAKGRPPEDREVDGIACRRFVLDIARDLLRGYLEAHLDRAVRAGSVSRPDEVRWSSTMKGSVAVYVGRKDGRLVKVKDDRSVKLAYRSAEGGQPDLKTYKLELEIDLSKWADTKLSLAQEVKERLGVKDE